MHNVIGAFEIGVVIDEARFIKDDSPPSAEVSILERSSRTPGYPIVPVIALLLAVVWLIAIAWFNTLLSLFCLPFMVAGASYFQLTKQQHVSAPIHSMLTGV